MFKKGDVDDVINYGPISLPSLFENMVNLNIVFLTISAHLFRIVYHFQHGTKPIDERGHTDIAFQGG